MGITLINEVETNPLDEALEMLLSYEKDLVPRDMTDMTYCVCCGKSQEESESVNLKD